MHLYQLKQVAEPVEAPFITVGPSTGSGTSALLTKKGRPKAAHHYENKIYSSVSSSATAAPRAVLTAKMMV